MGLGCSNVRLLTLTSRKADCEYQISIDSMEKQALTREQSELSRQYYAKLKNKNIAYYADGKYNKINYQYLMGYNNYFSTLGGTYKNSAYSAKQKPIKEDNNMILTDYNGRVVMSNYYKNVLVNVLGTDCIDKFGRGKTFSKDYIPAMIAQLTQGRGIKEENIRAVLDGQKVTTSSEYITKNNLTGQVTGTKIEESDVSGEIQNIIDFYYPIFIAASANGWTTEYNNDIERNDDYVSDALVTGSLQLADVDEYGNYNPDATLTYFCLSGLVIDRQDSDTREEITAWYNAEKERITEKENWLDVEISDLSTELEAINTEMESVKSYIDDNIQRVYSWGSS